MMLHAEGMREPAILILGMRRFNTTKNYVETFNGFEWVELIVRNPPPPEESTINHSDECSMTNHAGEGVKHVHTDPKSGFMHTCLHKCRSIFSWQFFVGMTISFPFEHALWTKVPGFSHIATHFNLFAH